MKKNKPLYVLLTEEENYLLEKAVAERGISKTDYVKERVFTERPIQLYGKRAEEAICEVTELLSYEMNKHCEDREFCKKCKEGAKKLWHSLNQ